MDNKDIRILYAEDDPNWYEDFMEDFKNDGFTQVHHVNDGHKLLDACTQHLENYDLILSDHSMRGPRGLEVLIRLGPARKIPFILLSGTDFEPNEIDLIKTNGGIYIGKSPEAFDEVKKIIKNLFANGRPAAKAELPPAL